MKKDKPDKNIRDKAKPGKTNKKDFPIKNLMTDDVKNTAIQTPGLNQSKTTRDDLLPSDGDNMTK